ncbi:hypothetical protein C8R47DRAFT_468072 [Mycena vitilis]|nr:hypothetical protein C8R47DRAFT_468072 [Mycena vitilis]
MSSRSIPSADRCSPQIKCALVQCVFSPFHPANCSGQRCLRTCWQYRQSPQQYTPHLNKRCEACRRKG